MPEKKSEQKEEAKEEKAKAHKQPKALAFPKQLPFYLCALLLLLSFAGGILFSYKFLPSLLPKAECPSDTNSSRAVDVIILYSNECALCEKTNSIIDVFNDRAIPYTLREVEVSTPEGKSLVAKYNVTEVPTALVSYEKMLYYTTTNEGLKQRFSRIVDRYVVTEINFNAGKFYNSMLLADDCNKTAGKASIAFFDDPYQELSLASSSFINSAFVKFKENISVDYIYVRTIDDSNYANEMVAAAGYFYCSAKEGKYIDFENSFRAKFCNFDGNGMNMTSEELLFCISGGAPGRLNQHPLDFVKLFEAASSAGIEGFSFDKCMEDTEVMFSHWQGEIMKYKIPLREKPIGIALVGCKYLVDAENLEKAICAANPLLEACKG